MPCRGRMGGCCAGRGAPVSKETIPEALGRAPHWPGHTSAPAEPKRRDSGWRWKCIGKSVPYALALPVGHVMGQSSPYTPRREEPLLKLLWKGTTEKQSVLSRKQMTCRRWTASVPWAHICNSSSKPARLCQGLCLQRVAWICSAAHSKLSHLETTTIPTETSWPPHRRCLGSPDPSRQGHVTCFYCARSKPSC